MSNILRTSTEHITAPLADEGNYAYCQHLCVKHIYLGKLALRGHHNTNVRTRDRTQNFLMIRTMP